MEKNTKNFKELVRESKERYEQAKKSGLPIISFADEPKHRDDEEKEDTNDE